MAGPDLLFIGKRNTSIESRTRQICNEFKYSMQCLENVDSLAEASEEVHQTPFCILCTNDAVQEDMIAGLVQVTRQFCALSYIAVVVDSKMTTEKLSFIKKSGANLILLESEITDSSKLEFATSQKIMASFLPVKTNELLKGSTMLCNYFHLMPLNQKWLPVLRSGQEYDEARHKKIEALQVSEVYVKREEMPIHKKYVGLNPDRSAKGLAGRCRVQYLNFAGSYNDLILMVMDQSETGSFDTGKVLYENCKKLSGELLDTLGAVGEPWEIINNSAIGDFGSIERGPAIASYAGLLSLLSGMGNPEEVMIGALLADIGILELTPKITRKLRIGEKDSLHPEDRELYEKHPVISLNRCLSRKLPISESIKASIMYSHEKANGTGFPHRIRSERISNEAKLIQLGEIIDQESLVKFGEMKPKILDIRKSVYEREFEANKTFDLAFLIKIKDQMIT